MIYTYKECIEKYKTNYEIQKLLSNGSLIRIHRGLYSDNDHEMELTLISNTYPEAVFTLNSAFYYHGLTDTIPKSYYLITDKNASKIKDSRITQLFDNNKSLEIGVEIKIYNGTEIRIFNRERLLIELIRNKKSFRLIIIKKLLLITEN